MNDLSIRLMNRDPLPKRRFLQNVSTSNHTRSVLKIRLNGYPFSVIGTSRAIRLASYLLASSLLAS